MINLFIVFKVFAGCCLSNLLMEFLMFSQPTAANLVTFLQFLSISLHGFIFTSNFGKVKPQIPIKQYTILVALFFVTSVANNYVYELHVSSTLHMIIRSASLPASVLVSWYAKDKPPVLNKTIGSVILSLGVCVATYGGATLIDEKQGIFLHWCVGVVILLSTLFLGALTGLQQEKLFAKYGSHHQEMLFYTNLLPLPFFMGMYQSILAAANELNFLIVLVLFANIICQFNCANAVYELATTETSVTVTLILTLRKFLSLIMSALIFKSNLTYLHVVGTGLVIIGTSIYFNLHQYSYRKANEKKVK